MAKVKIIYWSGTGNTEAMANAVLEGVKEAGAEGELLNCGEFDAAKVADYDAIAFGCPSMGAEQLEAVSGCATGRTVYRLLVLLCGTEKESLPITLRMMTL